MNAPGTSHLLADTALDGVSGGGLLGDAGRFAAGVVKGGVHYAALGIGHLMDAESHSKPFHKSVPAFFDKLMDKLL